MPRLTVVGSFLLLVILALNALTHESLISGESAILSNVIIDFVRHGVWHYPVHAQELFYPGVDKFMIHPPLHYLMASGWVSLFGIGVWQLHLQSVVSMLVGVAIVSVTAGRIYGVTTAALVPAMAIASVAFMFSAFEVRPDFTFGLIYGITILLFGCIYFQMGSAHTQYVLSFLLGLSTVLSLSAHWFGFFVQLYLPLFLLLMICRFGKNAVFLIALAAAGWLIAMSLWWYFFGEDLLRSLIFILIKGNDFRSSINVPASNSIVFLTEWSGGAWLVTGLALSLLWTGFLLFNKKRQTLPLQGQVAIFVIINLVAYSTFYHFFVGNKHPQYASNLLLLIYFLAAIGFSESIKAALSFTRKKWLPSVGVILVACISIGTSQVTGRYLDSPPLAFADATRKYDEVRAVLADLIPENAKLLLGAQAYPYLYDRPYESTMQLVASRFLEDPGEMSLSEATRYYLDMKRADYAESSFPLADRKRAIKAFDFIVISDSGSAWQFLFYEAEVWSNDFEELATIIMVTPTQQRHSFFPGHSMSYPNRFRVLMRKGLEKPRILTGPPKLKDASENILVATYGNVDRHTIVTGEMWSTLDPSEQHSAVTEYFNAIGWYCANVASSDKDQIVQLLLPHIQAYLGMFHNLVYRGLPMTRTIADAADYAFDSIGHPSSFLRTSNVYGSNNAKCIP
ncbi:glycosyltransferase family 39 protein [Luminiphilus sp.]|nr:glycosyltransferase family 39 protein [Luminiphilus sp.]